MAQRPEAQRRQAAGGPRAGTAPAVRPRPPPGRPAAPPPGSVHPAARCSARASAQQSGWPKAAAVRDRVAAVTAGRRPPAGGPAEPPEGPHSAPASGSAVRRGRAPRPSPGRPGAPHASPCLAAAAKAPGKTVVPDGQQRRLGLAVSDQGQLDRDRGPAASRASRGCQTRPSRRTGPGQPAAGRMADSGAPAPGASGGGRGQAGRPVTGRSPRVGERRPFRTHRAPPPPPPPPPPRRSGRAGRRAPGFSPSAQASSIARRSPGGGARG